MQRSVGIVGVVLVAACSSHTATPQPTPSAVPSSAPTVVAPPSPAVPSPSPVTSPRPSPVAVTPVCSAGQLRLSVQEADSGAGQFHQRIVLTNRRGACTLHGYPGVSFVDAQGRTLGSPAAKSEGTVRRVLVPTGRSAVAVLTYANAGAYPDSTCRPTTADRLRVYPPGSRIALLVRDPVLVCAAPGSDSLHIGPVEVSA